MVYGACLRCGNSREECECEEESKGREVRDLSSLGSEAEELQTLGVAGVATPLPMRLDEMK